MRRKLQFAAILTLAFIMAGGGGRASLSEGTIDNTTRKEDLEIVQDMSFISVSRLDSPQNINVVCNETGSVDLSWNSVDGADGYEVWQSIDGGKWYRVQILTTNSTHYVRMNQKATYKFKVCAWSGAINNRNAGDYSNEVSIIPDSSLPEAIPIPDDKEYVEEIPVQNTENETFSTKTAIAPDIKAEGTATSDTTATINWTFINGPCDKFVIYVSEDRMNWNQVSTVSNSANSINYGWLTSGKRYFYKIMARRNDTILCVSNIVEIVMPERKPSAQQKADNTNNNSVVNEAKKNTSDVSDNKEKNKPVENKPIENKSVEKKAETFTKTTNELVYDTLSYTNSLRNKQGLNPMVLDSTLCAAAQYRANDMAQDLVLAHYKNGKMQLKCLREKYPELAPLYLGENLAWVPGSAQDVSAVANIAWTQSSSHYTNIIDNKWTKTGIAYVQAVDGNWYCVQLFSN